MSLTGPILVTGGSGQVGSAVNRLAALRGLDVEAPDRTQLDLTDRVSISRAVESRRWSAVINCAAYTAVDKAEAEPKLAEAVNAAAPMMLAEQTAKLEIPLIHVSTDYVFDGTKASPYLEGDKVNPLGVYGLTKEAGESAVRAANPKHAIIRTAWVVSAGGANFLNTMLRLGAEKSEMRVVSDQIGSPSSATDIASALLAVAQKLDGRCGTWHFVNEGEVSWYDFASHIFAASSKRGMSTPSLAAISTDDYPTPAKRPANSCLATQAIVRDFSILPRPWQEAIDEILAERLKL